MLDQTEQPIWLRFSPLIIAQVGIGALLVAYYAEMVHQLEPCVLCIYQRIPYGLVLVFSFVGIFRPILLQWVLVLAGIAFLVGSGIAIYHVGVEQNWWVSSCSGKLVGQLSTSSLLQQLQEKPVKSCDELEWALFGVSMASYNVVYSFMLSVFCFFGVNKLRD
jgi:disulfide bond formation protein DsbB